MNTVNSNHKYVKRMRRRFAKIFINAKTSRAFFDDLAVKKLIIFNFIDFYNHFMNDVNVTN